VGLPPFGHIGDQPGAIVGPDARLDRRTTVAGDGRARSHGDGGSAVRASIDEPGAVAALPDGGFVVSDVFGYRLRRVSADGTIRSFAGTGVAAPDGAGSPVGDGESAGAALLSPSGRGLVATAEGGFVVTEFSRVRLITPGPRRLLGLAVAGVRDRVSPPAIRFRSPAPGVVRVVLQTPGGRVVSRAKRRSAPGLSAIGLPRRVPPGRYWVRLSAPPRAAGGHARRWRSSSAARCRPPLRVTQSTTNSRRQTPS
jgi:hypothetical protein